MSIGGLTAQQAAWKPAPERHSIWQIVRHVNHWKRATLGAWDGSRPLFSLVSSDTEYYLEAERTDWPDVFGDDTAWRRDRDALHAVSHQVAARAAALDPDALLKPFPGEEMPAVLRLLRMATHDIYHAGQIRYLRALQGV